MVNGAERWYGTVTGGGQTGSVRVPRRCGYSLGLNRQFHVLVAVGGSLAGERLLAQDWLGVGLVSAGIFGLASRGAVRPAAVGWALGTGVAIGTYTTIDGPASEMDTLHQFEALSPLPGPHLSRPAPHHSAELSSRSS